ncbi:MULTISPECIES: TM2 domain-containing protein [Rubrivirga]|uniref:TM2 domain-containing protein n=1 Tax=Rubrivirga TaxID=1434037 RepID=UPI0032C24BE2
MRRPAAARAAAARPAQDRRADSSKPTATLLALLLGGVGAHRFYLDQWRTGLVMLFWWTEADCEGVGGGAGGGLPFSCKGKHIPKCNELFCCISKQPPRECTRLIPNPRPAPNRPDPAETRRRPLRRLRLRLLPP